MENNLGNKKTMADNIRYYLDKKGISQKQLCEDLGFSQSTFSYWLTAKTYPRINKIEQMANYFHITKSDLVEERVKKEPVATNSNELIEKVSRLSPELLVKLNQFLELAKDNPESATQFLSFAVQAFQSSQQSH